MGSDGEFTFYIDLVNGTFAKSSTSVSDPKQIFNIRSNDTVDSMFNIIRGNLHERV